MKKRLFLCVLCLLLALSPAHAADGYIKWVDFDIGASAMARALALDIESRDSEQPVNWIDILALAATWTGSGKFSNTTVNKAARALTADQSIEKQLGNQIGRASCRERVSSCV